MSVADKMTAIANAIRGKTGGTEALTLDQMAAAIAGIEAGGGDGGALELVFETEFTIATTPTSKVTAATFNTGLNLDEGELLYFVIVCTNDTDTDTSYRHLYARTQTCSIIGGKYTSIQSSGVAIASDGMAGYAPGSSTIYVSVFGYGGGSVTLTAIPGSAAGTPPSGDYSVKIYRFNHAYFGIEV